MMQYEPSPYTALAVYTFAMAHHLKISIIAIDHPGMSNIKETKPGRFLIQRPSERENQAPFVPGPAVCTYEPDTELWHVKLPDHAVLIVRHDAGQFTVVGG